MKIQKFKFLIDGHQYEWETPTISGDELLNLAKIGPDQVLYFKDQGNDLEVHPTTSIELSKPGTEHFFKRPKDVGNIVTILINNSPFLVKRGNYTVTEVKEIGNVPLAYDLSQLIDGVLQPLNDGGIVTIKGGEKFYGSVKSGASS